MENEKRLIDANALEQHIADCFGYPAVDILHEIATFPTVDAVEVVHGEWRLGKFNCGRETVFAECSVCDAVFEVSSFSLNLNYNYCPNCGAKMDGDGNG